MNSGFSGRILFIVFLLQEGCPLRAALLLLLPARRERTTLTVSETPRAHERVALAGCG